MQSLKAHLSNADVAEELLQAVGCLSSQSAGNRSSFAQCNALGLIVSSLLKHEKQETLVEQALFALMHLLQSPASSPSNLIPRLSDDSNSEDEEVEAGQPWRQQMISTLISLNGCKLIPRLVSRYHDSARIAELGCRCMIELCTVSRGGGAGGGGGGEGGGARRHSSLLSSSPLSPSSPPSPANSTTASGGDAVIGVFTSKHDLTGRATHYTDILYNSGYCGEGGLAHPEYCQKLGQGGAAAAVCSALQLALSRGGSTSSSPSPILTVSPPYGQTDDSYQYLAQCALIVAHFLCVERSNLTSLKSNGLPALVVQCLAAHYRSSRSLHDLCCQVIGRLCVEDVCRSALCSVSSPDLAQVLLSAAAYHRHSPSSALLSCVAISSLCVSPLQDALACLSQRTRDYSERDSSTSNPVPAVLAMTASNMRTGDAAQDSRRSSTESKEDDSNAGEIEEDEVSAAGEGRRSRSDVDTDSVSTDPSTHQESNQGAAVARKSITRYFRWSATSSSSSSLTSVASDANATVSHSKDKNKDKGKERDSKHSQVAYNPKLSATKLSDFYGATSTATSVRQGGGIGLGLDSFYQAASSMISIGLSDAEADMIAEQRVVSSSSNYSSGIVYGSAGLDMGELGSETGGTGVVALLESLLREHGLQAEAHSEGLLLMLLNAINSVALTEHWREGMSRSGLVPLLVEIYGKQQQIGYPFGSSVVIAALNVTLGTLFLPLSSGGGTAAANSRTLAVAEGNLPYSSDDAMNERFNLALAPEFLAAAEAEVTVVSDSSEACRMVVATLHATLAAQSHQAPANSVIPSELKSHSYSVRVMKPLLCETALRALHCLLLDNKDNLTLCVELQGHKAVAQILRSFSDIQIVAYHAMQCVHVLADGQRDASVELGRCGIVPLLCQVWL